MFVSYESKKGKATGAGGHQNGTPTGLHIDHLNLQQSVTTENQKSKHSSKVEKVKLPDIKFTFNASDTDIVRSIGGIAESHPHNAQHQSPMNYSEMKSPSASKTSSYTTIPSVTLSTLYLKEHRAWNAITQDPLHADMMGPSQEEDEEEDSDLRNVYIGGLFELTDTPGIVTYGRSELAAAKLAIRHINQQGLLPGYKLHMVYNDTKVNFNNNCLFLQAVVVVSFKSLCRSFFISSGFLFLHSVCLGHL